MDESSKYKLGNCQIYLATISCPKDGNHRFWSDVAHAVALAAGLTPLEWNTCSYPGGGLTITYFLSESHIAIDTYPEHELADITLVSCKHFEVDALEKVLNKNGIAVQQRTILQKRYDHKWRAF